MTTQSITRSRGSAVATSAIALYTCFLLVVNTGLRAQDGADKADSMLDNLRRRTAEERWERMKKLYPNDPPSPRRKMPARLPDDRQLVLPEDELPPSPDQATLIPQLSELPTDEVPDWVLPARPIESIDHTEVGARTARVEVAQNADNDTPVPTNPVVAPQGDTQSNASEKNPTSVTKALRKRNMGEIMPYYDRDKDKDIRAFAVEKAKEFDIQFRPTAYEDRVFPQMVLPWEPTNFYHFPLYFSDPALERYGHAHHPLVQPWVSVARFSTQFLFLPYQVTINPVCKEEYPLGWYRPGDCAPKLHYQVPLNAEAAAVQAGFVAGLYFVIP